MYLMMWSVALWPANNPVIDDHILGAISMAVLGLTLAGDTWGFGKVWSRLAPRRRPPGPAVTALTHAGEDTAADSPTSSSGDTVAPLPYSVSGATGPLSADELALTDAWWRAANYLAVGQIYLRDNPLLTEPLLPEHVKPRLLGHFGTVPGLNLVHVHANRQILARGLSAVFVAGPGHGGPGPNACAWLEGTYSEQYSHVPQDAAGMQRPLRAVLLPGWRPQPLRTGDARLPARGR